MTISRAAHMGRVFACFRPWGAGPTPLWVVLSAVLFSALAIATPLTAHAQQDKSVAAQEATRFDIAAGLLSESIERFGEQSGLRILYQPELAGNQQAPAVIGQMSAAAALALLLRDSGLVGIHVNDKTLVLRRAADAGDQGADAGSPDGETDLPREADSITPAPGRVASNVPGSVEVGRQGGIEEIIVTGQKKEERIQDVPIAISAFSMEQLDNQKIEGGFDLLKAIPNVTFTKSNFTGYNFQIRGIGTQAISATTDPGVAVSFNNTTLIVNRLFEQEYLDIERVEVLRGPQGTLYGRNATAGVVNVISAKPEMGVYSGEIKLETGNYGAQRFRGHVNVPLGPDDTLAARLAFAMTKRDGYGTNLAEGLDGIGGTPPASNALDDRNLWTGRFSLGWQPTDRLRANLIYERFEENDHRLRTAKQLCHYDPGLTKVNGFSLSDIPAGGSITSAQRALNAQVQLSQGCLPGSLFDKGNPADPNVHGAYGTPNGNTIPFIRSGRGSSFIIGHDPFTSPAFENNRPCANPYFAANSFLISPCVLDPLAGGKQSQDLRTIFTLLTPRYEAISELLEFSVDYEIMDGITVSSQSVYTDNELFSTQDFLRFETVSGLFPESESACSGSPGAPCRDLPRSQVSFSWNPYFRNVTPGGVFVDPIVGAADRLVMQDVSQQESRQFSQEFRIVSGFDGPLNFSFGVNYTKFENTADYFVFANVLSALALTGAPFSGDPNWNQPFGQVGYCGARYTLVDGKGLCAFVQGGSIDEVRNNPEGHNFFLSRNPYSLSAAAAFGEMYYSITPALKLTAGLRLNWDRKTFTPSPSQTMLSDWRGMADGPFGNQLDAEGSIDQCSNRAVARQRGYILACALGGLAPNGRGYPALPDIVQEWRVPTGRFGVDWKLDTGFTDETLLYTFYTRGYKGGGANPPGVSPTQGLLIAGAQGAEAPRVFEPEYVNAFEVGAKNRLFGGAITLNANAFYYDYTDYQVSKIVDRSAANENFDATIWGLELETVFSPAVDTVLNATIGYLKTRVADGEQSLDLMDRTQGGNQSFTTPSGVTYDEWVVIKPTLTQASNCVAPAVLLRPILAAGSLVNGPNELSRFCPGGDLFGEIISGYDPTVDAPNGGAGFFANIGGNELPNAPRFTVSLGAQQTYWLPGGDWSATGRVDWYWQDQAYHRVYNTEYDRLKDWRNVNLSVWVSSDRNGLTIEAYVKNLLNETPITGAFLNSDDTGLSTNVFTLDPRLIGLSIRKRF